MPFDPATFARPGVGGAADPADASRVKAAMQAFCALYDNADADAVPDVLSEDFYEVRSSHFHNCLLCGMADAVVVKPQLSGSCNSVRSSDHVT